MKIIVLQHIANETPGYIKDLMIEDRVEITTIQLDEKDSIPKTKGATWNLLTKLGDLKNKNRAFHGGKTAASYERLSTENEDVVAFKRSKEEAEVYFIGNLSNQDQTFSIKLEGSYKDLLQHENIVFKDDKLKLAPWNYYLVSKNNNE